LVERQAGFLQERLVGPERLATLLTPTGNVAGP